jgi:hypothetical protein
VQPQTRRRLPQGDGELMAEKQILGFEPASRLEHVATNIASIWRIASITSNDALILPHGANLHG